MRVHKNVLIFYDYVNQSIISIVFLELLVLVRFLFYFHIYSRLRFGNSGRKKSWQDGNERIENRILYLKNQWRVNSPATEIRSAGLLSVTACCNARYICCFTGSQSGFIFDLLSTTIFSKTVHFV